MDPVAASVSIACGVLGEIDLSKIESRGTREDAYWCLAGVPSLLVRERDIVATVAAAAMRVWGMVGGRGEKKQEMGCARGLAGVEWAPSGKQARLTRGCRFFHRSRSP